MGFFSWECKGCGESIKSPYSLPKGMEWQNDAVAITDSGAVYTGAYDGYGRINGHLENTLNLLYDLSTTSEEPEMWHARCYLYAGKPKYSGPSLHAADQGYFYDE